MSEEKTVSYQARLVYEDGYRYAYGCKGSDWYALIQADEALAKDTDAVSAEIVRIETTITPIGTRERGMAPVAVPDTVEQHDAIMASGMKAVRP